MFNDINAFVESMEAETNNPFMEYDSLTEALADSIVDAYNDIMLFNEFCLKADMKEAGMIAANESAEVRDAFVESMKEKASNFISALKSKASGVTRKFAVAANKRLISFLSNRMGTCSGVSEKLGRIPEDKVPQVKIYGCLSAGIGSAAKKVASAAKSAMNGLSEFSFEMGEKTSTKLSAKVFAGCDSVQGVVKQITDDIAAIADKKINAVKAKETEENKKEIVAQISKIGIHARKVIAAAVSAIRKLVMNVSKCAARIKVSRKAEKPAADGKQESAFFDMSSIDLSVE